MEEDYYKLLGIDRSASQEEIQKAYRRFARKYHPDLNPDDKTAKENFQKIQNAYDTLNDPQKREMYDRYGSSFGSYGPGGPQGGGWQTHGGGAPGGFSFEEVDLSDLFGGRAGEEGGFSDMFRQFTGGSATRPRGGRRRAARGSDLMYELTVPFQTAIVGGKMNLTIQRENGKTEGITVTIPAGIAEGKKIRLRGQGEAPPGAAPGDLIITVGISSHPFYRRRGNDLEMRLPITLDEAVLGAKVDVPTPKGTITVTIPPKTSSGKKLRIKGHGVGDKGDLFVETAIVLPDRIDEDDLEAVKQMARRHSYNPRGDLRW